jgi:hypothetical protein
MKRQRIERGVCANSVEVKEPCMSCCVDLGKYLDAAELERYLRELGVGSNPA